MPEQFTGGFPPLEYTQSCETALTIQCYVAIHCCLGNLGQACRLGVGQALTDEPQNFRTLLDPRIGMLKAFLVQSLLLFFGKR